MPAPRPSSASPSASPGEPFAARLVAWHAHHGRRDLPWQGTRDAYRIWLSEIMLQQTQVATATPYYLRFVARFPDVVSLAAAPVDRVLELWSGLGYYRRAHHLHAAAQRVMDVHAGRFPTDAATLETLPGIGRSTAAAIAAFASGERGAILDGNVKRVLARHAGIDGYPGEPRVAARLWDVAQARVAAAPGVDIGHYTQAMMDLGATVCLRTRPRCDACPVSGDCVALATHRVGELPSPRPRRAVPQREAEVLVAVSEGRLLLERRPATGVWSGLWSLPERGVEGVGAWLGAEVLRVAPLPPVVHAFTHFTLTMRPCRVELRGFGPRAEQGGLRWFTRDEALAAALPAPVRRIVEQLAGLAHAGGAPRDRVGEAT